MRKGRIGRGAFDLCIGQGLCGISESQAPQCCQPSPAAIFSC
jgi:hypothetical protein